MRIVPLSEVVVEEGRQREEFEPEALSDLCDDICLNGLQHAPVVRTKEGRTVLVSGERRLRVISDLASAGVSIRYGTLSVPLDHIPVTDFGELSERDAQILELHENIKRKDLLWQERIAAEARLHEIRTAQAVEEGRRQTYTATAEEILGKPLSGSTEQAWALQQVRESVQLARHLEDPEVAKAASVKEALKIVQRKTTEQHYKQLAERLGKSQSTERHTLLRGDSRELLPGLATESFDVLLTDPPYGIDAQSFGTQVSNSHKFDDSLETWLELMQLLARESFRFCKPEAHAYVFCDPRRFDQLQILFTSAGWDVWTTPLIWSKRSGMLPRPEHGPRRAYEAILYAIKGNKKTTGVYSDVLEYSPEKTTIHPDQKPVALYADLLKRSARPGNLVCDPFCGSGTIFVAANQLQLTATGVEKEETSFAISTERLKGKEATV